MRPISTGRLPIRLEQPRREAPCPDEAFCGLACLFTPTTCLRLFPESEVFGGEGERAWVLLTHLPQEPDRSCRLER